MEQKTITRMVRNTALFFWIYGALYFLFAIFNLVYRPLLSGVFSLPFVIVLFSPLYLLVNSYSAGLGVLQVVVGFALLATGYGLWKAQRWARVFVWCFAGSPLLLLLSALFSSIGNLSTLRFSPSFFIFLLFSIFLFWLFFLKRAELPVDTSAPMPSVFVRWPWLSWFFVALPAIVVIPTVLVALFSPLLGLFRTTAVIGFLIAVGLALALIPLRTTRLLRETPGWSFILIGTSVVYASIISIYCAAFTDYGFAKMDLGYLAMYVGPFLLVTIVCSLLAAYTARREVSTTLSAVLYWSTISLVSLALFLPLISQIARYFAATNILIVPYQTILFVLK